MTTLVAGSGPLSVSLTVKVTVSPTLGVGLLTALVRCRSARRGVAVVLALLFVVSGSNWSLWLMAAAFVATAGPTTVARMARVAFAPPGRVPTLHRPVPLLYEP